jgi:hypothetical protein
MLGQLAWSTDIMGQKLPSAIIEQATFLCTAPKTTSPVGWTKGQATLPTIRTAVITHTSTTMTATAAPFVTCNL